MRNAAFLALGMLLILVQTNLYRLLDPVHRLLDTVHVHGAIPSLVLPLIVFLGVHEHSTPRGAVLAFTLGYALDLFAASPMWLLTFLSVTTWWLARIAGVRLTAQTTLTRMSLAFAFAILQSGIILILLAIFGDDTRRPLEIGRTILPHAVATALFAPLVFKLAQKLHQGSLPAGAGAAAAPEGGAA
jgi:rod shape-determining protein MreD